MECDREVLAATLAASTPALRCLNDFDRLLPIDEAVEDDAVAIAVVVCVLMKGVSGVCGDEDDDAEEDEDECDLLPQSRNAMEGKEDDDADQARVSNSVGRDAEAESVPNFLGF